jgi:hypothetical protein
MMKIIYFITFLLLGKYISAQTTVIAFYNLENLYDTVDNPLVNDDEFTPKGVKKYGTAIYKDKLFHLATVLSSMGTNHDPLGASIIGVAEIENDTVLTDLKNHFLLRERNYRFIHFNSRDLRGVDVALFYRVNKFTPIYSTKLEVVLPNGAKQASFTRDILYVKGILLKDTVHFFVNHWPSRRGGEERSAPARESAAAVCRKTIDSIFRITPNAAILVMGDLNDNPSDKSIVQTLKSSGNKNALRPDELYNPWVAFMDRGIGTLAHNDAWGLFDQILLSRSFLNTKQPGWQFQEAFIFYRPYLTEINGKYRGYPMRTWDGNTYHGGFSDHFPTYIVLKSGK